ncbi:MAG: hypothetical protein JWM39_644 [Parcubacteria group bacterium]|nr:hypothetical protein [Parcubacteria group bacterium]
MQQIVQRSDFVLLEKVAKLHVAPDPEVASVLLLDGTHMRIIALVSEATVLIPGTVTWHIHCILLSHKWACVNNAPSAPCTYRMIKRCKRSLLANYWSTWPSVSELG